MVAEMMLPPVVRRAISELIEEHYRRDLLRSHGVEPCHRLLLVGPPGDGKTSLAEVIATELAVPLLSVRYEGLTGAFSASSTGALRRSADDLQPGLHQPPGGDDQHHPAAPARG